MELFRFRVVRPVLSQPSRGLYVSAMFDPPLDAKDLQQAADALADQSPDTRLQEKERWLRRFSSQLALRSDLVSPKECSSLLPSDWLDQVVSQGWINLGHQLAHQLVAAMSKQQPPAAVESLCRDLLVFDLVTTLAKDGCEPADEHRLKTAADVRAMVSWRHVILPADFFPGKSGTPLLARRPGVADFYVVQDEWNHYDAGELAAVINVLPGETFENRIRHSQEVDTLTSTTTETTTSQTTEHDQTASTSLSESSSKDASLNIGVQGQVQTSGQYGMTHVNTSLGAQLQISQTQSDSKAATTAYQTVQRAVKSVSQTVTTVQSQRTVTRDSSYDDHKLQNTSSDVTVGMYRWLSEIHYVQLVRYPNRFIMEFEIPEPGAWLRWALQNTPTTGWDNPDPGPFRLSGADHDLSPADITPDDYSKPAQKQRGTWITLAQQWRVRGLSPPPPEQITIATQLEVAPPTENPFPPKPHELNIPRIAMAADESLTVPGGYQADTWTAQLIGYKAGGTENHDEAWITVGASSTSQQTVWDQQDPADPKKTTERLVGSPVGPNSTTTFDVGEINTGTIPISVYAFEFVNGFSCNISLACKRLPETLAQWQQGTFDQVAAAYQTLLNAFHQERDVRSQQVSGTADLAGPPELNQSRVVNELRRMVIQDLRDKEMAGEDDVQTGAANPPPFGPDEPYVPLRPLTDTHTIQFFEQALEWENIVYICYPYYWARHSQWITDVTSASADPVFDQFLNAGSARVVVPARPGFENLMLFYLYTGLIWGGSQPPAPNDPDYLSVAQEIEALQKGATDGTPISPSWQIELPTTLLWAGTDQETLPKNPTPTIPPPSTS